MRSRLGWLVLFVVCAQVEGFAAHPKPCVTPDEASELVNKDVCISAHVYDVVELPDGTRFLDVCSPDTPDEQCRFTIVSPRDDRREAGELRKYRDMDVHVRGIVQPMHGRAGITLSHARQFYGGPPKFRPNPKLASRIRRRSKQAAHQRPEPAPAGRTSRIHEFPRPGAPAEELVKPRPQNSVAAAHPSSSGCVERGAKRAPDRRIAHEITRNISVAPRPMLRLVRSEIAPIICGENVSPKK